MKRRLLILHDSAQFGGHERMTLALLPGLLAAGSYDRITFAYPTSNERLGSALAEAFPMIHRVPWAFVKRRAEPYLRFLRLDYRNAVRRLVAEERPTTILLVQGRIENLATAMLAIPRSIPLISYIPMAHRLGEIGRSGWIGDRVRRSLYRRPDAFIVPSNAVARQLVAAGATAPATVAANTVSPPPRLSREAARTQLGLDSAAKIALVLGRLETAQKGLDQLAVAVKRMRRDAGWMILVVGDGPGLTLMTDLAGVSGGRVILVPWTDQPDLYLSATDVLLMPSRWEGLPLVALEAMTYEVPVLASRLDAFADMLSADHLIDWERDELAAAMDRVVAPTARARFVEHCRAYLAPLSLGEAKRAFVRALTGEETA